MRPRFAVAFAGGPRRRSRAAQTTGARGAPAGARSRKAGLLRRGLVDAGRGEGELAGSGRQSERARHVPVDAREVLRHLPSRAQGAVGDGHGPGRPRIRSGQEGLHVRELQQPGDDADRDRSLRERNLDVVERPDPGRQAREVADRDVGHEASGYKVRWETSDNGKSWRTRMTGSVTKLQAKGKETEKKEEP